MFRACRVPAFANPKETREGLKQPILSPFFLLVVKNPEKTLGNGPSSTICVFWRGGGTPSTCSASLFRSGRFCVRVPTKVGVEPINDNLRAYGK